MGFIIIDALFDDLLHGHVLLVNAEKEAPVQATHQFLYAFLTVSGMRESQNINLVKVGIEGGQNLPVVIQR